MKVITDNKSGQLNIPKITSLILKHATDQFRQPLILSKFLKTAK